MKKILLLMFLCFIILGYTNVTPLLADEDDDSNSGSNSNSVSNSDSEETDDETNDAKNDKRSEIELRNGKERIKERIKERNGKIVREVKGRFIDEDGNEVKFKRKIKTKDGEVEIETKLKVEGEGSNLSVSDSEGRKHKVRVTPEKLRALMQERLNANNVTDFSLEEIEHKNIPRVVYKINSDHPGRFLGIFKIALRAETQIDPETGEILAINGPWWAFLVAEQLPDEDEIVGNETLAEEVVADDDELEDEFEDVEVEEELEIKAETFDGKSEVKVEVEFDTTATTQEEIVTEILERLSLDSSAVDSLLEIEESDEPIEDKEKLEAEAEVEEETTEVEFEWKFVVDSDNQEDISNAIATKLSELTAENLNSVFVFEIDDEEENETEDEDEEEENESSVTGEVVETQEVEPIVLN